MYLYYTTKVKPERHTRTDVLDVRGNQQHSYLVEREERDDDDDDDDEWYMVKGKR